jgi:hypothetical protein
MILTEANTDGTAVLELPCCRSSSQSSCHNRHGYVHDCLDGSYARVIELLSSRTHAVVLIAFS